MNTEESEWYKKFMKRMRAVANTAISAGKLTTNDMKEFKRDEKTIQELFDRWKNGCPNCSQKIDGKNIKVDKIGFPPNDTYVFYKCKTCHYQEGFR